MRPLVIENPLERLQASSDPGKCWLMCDECRRFFQYERALPDAGRPHERCPFPDCYGVGLGFNLFLWDALREAGDPRWPDSSDQLENGMPVPDPEPFYAAQLAARIEQMVGAFAGSPECAAALADGSPRYLAAFFKMMSDLCCDLTDPEDPVPCSLAWDNVDQLPAWSQTGDLDEVPRMLAELRAFFAFAARTGTVNEAATWVEHLADDEAADMLAHAMRTDRRIRPATQRPSKKRRPRRNKQRKRRRR